MRRILAATCMIALPLRAAFGARAADQPTLTPTRDVDITYRVAGPNGTAEQRVRWDVAGGRQRIDPPTPGLHIIVDTHTHHLDSIRDAEQLVLELDATVAVPRPGADPAYARHGTDTVAGLPCTVWQAGASEGGAELCFTDDGVLLRITAGGHVVTEAETVTYGPSNPVDFAIPSGYRRIGAGQTAKKPAAATPDPAAPKESPP